MRRKIFGWILIVFLLLMLLCGGAGWWAWQKVSPASPEQKRVARAVKPEHFDLFRYETGAVVDKIAEAWTRPGARLTPEQQVQLVQDYVALARQVQRLDARIQRIYADPAQTEPEKASQALQKQREQALSLLHRTRPMAEAILQQQARATLQSLDLDTAGIIWPPVLFNFSALPNYLILSPRDHIELKAGVHLRPDLSLPEKERIEQQVAAQFGDSTLVESLGGLGVWPTMVSDEADLTWIADTIIHEWLHTYMAFHPLGWHMFDSPQMDTINETVATLVGQEAGQELAWRYYGIPKPEPQILPQSSQQLPPPDPNRFDFRLEMRRTRLHVDDLLAAGHIDEAEAYMEARRQFFVQHGYSIRKLNQAYFAFHGSYATGSASSDPIGPKLRELRAQMPDLASFVRAVQGISQPEALDALLAQTR
jgi:hypothetical protein